MIVPFRRSKQLWATLAARASVVCYSTLLPRLQCKYTTDHEWVHLEQPNMATIGITDVAQKALGDVVYVELPKVGQRVQQKAPIGVVESVKGASDIFSPVAGTIAAVNHELEKKPSLINKDVYHAGWLCKLKVDHPEECSKLMDEEAYLHFCKSNPQH